MRKRLLYFAVLFCLHAHAQVRLDSYGDTLKGNVKRMTQYSLSIKNSDLTGVKPDTTKSIYTYDVSTGIELIKFYNEQNKQTAREEIRFDSRGHVVEDNSYTDLDSLFKRCTYKYDTHGRQIQEREINYPFHASYKIDYGDVETEFKDSLGSCIKYAYDNTDLVTEKTEEEIWDSRTTTSDLAAYRYDAKGKKIEEYKLNLRICGQEEKYFLFYFGGKGYSSKTVLKYDSLNRLKELTEYSERKTPAPYSHEEHTGTHIGTKKLYNYNGQDTIANDLTIMSLFRESDGSITTGAQMTMPNWAAKTNEVLEYDTHGNVIKKTRWGQLVFERTIEYSF